MAKKPRVLVCAPTNTALGRLTRQLISLLENSSEAESIQDITLLGNEERLKVKEDKDMSKVYLKNRVKQQQDKFQKVDKLNKEFQKLSRGRELNDRTREKVLLEEAKLVFCTPFISSRVKHQNFNILVIDEAAYLKECESMIPLAHTNIEHLMLIGDHMQLPPLVKSPVCLHYMII
jgi:superfamily I DNA and/or RNA helicase